MINYGVNQTKSKLLEWMRK